MHLFIFYNTGATVKAMDKVNSEEIEEETDIVLAKPPDKEKNSKPPGRPPEAWCMEIIITILLSCHLLLEAGVMVGPGWMWLPSRSLRLWGLV